MLALPSYPMAEFAVAFVIHCGSSWHPWRRTFLPGSPLNNHSDELKRITTTGCATVELTEGKEGEFGPSD